jgi:hypothetical protein
MTGPTIAVATAALRTEAIVWDNQSQRLNEITVSANALRITGYDDTTLFDRVLTAYSHVVDVVTARCTEGSQRTGEIGSRLRQVATVYDTEEQANIHAKYGLY